MAMLWRLCYFRLFSKIVNYSTTSRKLCTTIPNTDDAKSFSSTGKYSHDTSKLIGNPSISSRNVMDSTETQTETKISLPTDVTPISNDCSATKSHDTESNENFLSMIRNSKLMQIGDPNGRVVAGTIIEVVGDDLYIDVGGKFHCVCQRPQVRSREYFRGVRVKVRLHDFEMSSKFLGSDKHVTLLEADATLIGLHHFQKNDPKYAENTSERKESH